jgi:elongation factor Ts
VSEDLRPEVEVPAQDAGQDAPRSVSAKDVKELRDRTGAGMMDSKSALVEADGDMDKAVEILRIKGQARAAKRGERAASEGVVSSYVHAGGKIGVIVEVNCETDFVARTEGFQEFARDVALHIAAAAPLYVSEDDVPEEARGAELRILREQAAEDGKAEDVQAKIAEGRLRKWLEEVVLLNQAHVNADKYDGRTIEELRAEAASKTGENVQIRRFARFAVGEE